MPSARATLSSKALRVQLHIKLPKLKGAEYTADFLNEITGMWLRNEPMPKGVKIIAVEWRNQKVSDPRRMNDARDNFSRITGWNISTKI